MEISEILDELRSLADPEAVKGMVRFGIKPGNILGISIPKLTATAKKIGKDHLIAERLWASSIHEAKILACMVDIPDAVTEEQMERWVKDFDSWDVCDQCCNRLFGKTPFAYQKAFEWAERPEEFVKRAGFVLMCQIAVHDKKADDSKIEPFFPVIKKGASDERNFVKKAVNWALRQIGKRNLELNAKAVLVAEEIRYMESKPAKWIANDALRELRNEKILERLSGSGGKRTK